MDGLRSERADFAILKKIDWFVACQNFKFLKILLFFECHVYILPQCTLGLGHKNKLIFLTLTYFSRSQVKFTGTIGKIRSRFFRKLFKVQPFNFTWKYKTESPMAWYDNFESRSNPRWPTWLINKIIISSVLGYRQGMGMISKC